MMPFTELADGTVARGLARGSHPTQPPACPDNVFELMKRCWARVPHERISAAKLTKELVALATLSLDDELSESQL